jgi:hypothetical protein
VKKKAGTDGCPCWLGWDVRRWWIDHRDRRNRYSLIVLEEVYKTVYNQRERNQEVGMGAGRYFCPCCLGRE